MLRYLIGRIRFTEIQAGINCVRVLRRHPPELVLYDNRCIIAHTKLQKQDMLTFVLLQIIIVTLCCHVPALVLNELIIASEVHTIKTIDTPAFICFVIAFQINTLVEIDHPHRQEVPLLLIILDPLVGIVLSVLKVYLPAVSDQPVYQV